MNLYYLVNFLQITSSFFKTTSNVVFFLHEKTEAIFLNEINTIPGFTEISMYPKLWEVSGLSYANLLERLIELGLEAHRLKKRNTEGSAL